MSANWQRPTEPSKLSPDMGAAAAAAALLTGMDVSKVVGIETAIGCHTFRATGISDCLTNGGRIEVAQRMAGH